MIATQSVVILALLCAGCASMSKLEPPQDGSARRTSCQKYVNSSTEFIGEQQGFGVAFGVLALTSTAVGAAVTNADDGGAWVENKKTILLSAAIPSALLAYNFLNNASAAGSSVSQASVALAEGDDNVMWDGCQRARGAYFDGRVAGIGATSAAIGKPTPTPAQKEAAGYAKSAEGMVEVAKKQVQDARDAADAAKKANAPPVVQTKIDEAVKAAELAAGEAESAAADAVKAATEGDVGSAKLASEKSQASKEKAKQAADEAKGAVGSAVPPAPGP
jgi:hypothetical protein